MAKNEKDTDSAQLEKVNAVLAGDLIEDNEDALLDEDEQAIPDELVFVTPERTQDDRDKSDREADESYLEFTIDGQMLVAHKPSKGAWTVIMAALSNSATAADRTNAILQFVYASLDSASQMYVQTRILAPEDEFDVDVLAQVVNTLITKWAPKQSRAQRRAQARKRG